MVAKTPRAGVVGGDLRVTLDTTPLLGGPTTRHDLGPAPRLDDDTTRPAHYGGDANPFEPIKIIEWYGLGFCLGNTIKYLLRAGRKSAESRMDDFKKARWYLDRHIARLETETGGTDDTDR